MRRRHLCRANPPTFGSFFILLKREWVDTPEYQRHSKCRLKTTVFVGASQQDMHGEYADKQLVNLQKRIFLIEFLHLGLVIVYQGTYPLPPKDTPHH